MWKPLTILGVLVLILPLVSAQSIGTVSFQGDNLTFVQAGNPDNKVYIRLTATLNGTEYDVTSFITFWKKSVDDGFKWGANISIPDSVPGEWIAENLELINFKVATNLDIHRYGKGFYYENEEGNMISFDFSDLFSLFKYNTSYYEETLNETFFYMKPVDTLYNQGALNISGTMYRWATLQLNVTPVTFIRGQTLELDPSITITDLYSYSPVSFQGTSKVAHPALHAVSDSSTLKSYMPFNLNASSTGWNYVSSNMGLYSGANITNDDHRGSALHCDGIDSFGWMGNIDWDLDNEFAISMWIKPYTLDPAYQSLWYAGQYAYPFILRINSNRIRFGVRTDGGVTHHYDPTKPIPVNEWTMITVGWKDEFSYIYQNDTLVLNESKTGVLQSSLQSQQLCLVPGASNNPYWGAMDDVMLFNTSLTQQNVTDLYHSRFKLFTSPPSTVQLHNFSADSGENRVNITGNYFLPGDSMLGLRIQELNTNTNTSWQYVTNGSLQQLTFNISNTCTNFTLEYNFSMGNYSYFAPVIYDSLTVSTGTFDTGEPPITPPTICTNHTYSGSGDWNISCTHNAYICNNTNVGGNKLILDGAGTFMHNASIVGVSAVQVLNGCHGYSLNGARITT